LFTTVIKSPSGQAEYFTGSLKCRARNVLVRASEPTEKQNIWTDAEKSKPNEQKQREKLELNERLSLRKLSP